MENYEDEYIANTYQRLPVHIKNGEEARLYDENGKEYIDMMGGYGVAIFGYSNDKIKKAVCDQMDILPIAHASEYTEARNNFVKKLADSVPAGIDKFYLGNTGAEAIEAAIKVVKKSSKKHKLVAMTNSYHGKTLGALSITYSNKYRKYFDDILIKDVQFIRYNNTDDLKLLEKDDDIAAVFFEPVQGEGGINIPDYDYVRELREITEKNNIIFVADEIQSGLGRTGKMWAHQHFDITPDIITIGKGIGGGIPMSVTAGRHEFMDNLEKGEQSSTTGGNPIACAAGTAVLEQLTLDLINDVAKKGEYFRSKLNESLNDVKIVKEVRGLGLMNAIELRVKFLPVLMDLINKGVLALYSGINIIRMLSPYVISYDDLSKASSIIGESINEYYKEVIK
ncbi:MULTISPECIES: aspartate aminotransferase family protein [Acidiplasma]|jgi:acetylornithine/LysW-gamma-L-lysine aminotransferase|uniref:Acetylornithine aminotransferase n=2 Tax=Acidiplasma TaxID=507753 RepID=A0A0Q1B1C4_9ARCH|nr:MULTISPECIES: aminotransferase class III-fold pyridoxal phosphate-dependent enzyme [Acidiplasma]KJE49745.1 acetylornithine aminotransferase [Acidiplasma sp. MBA-1]KPV46013.1 acetylornithine aminotransferase [Acidiplasma aeolicum]KQB33558.1 acetylornithine aminotransferase [Acidiplasma cupricumulans]KQB34767.1 acetylornithine aminotransferase [Acidiplasma aeolicum]WMT55695.1 MAG: aminotransferase class III-fold pyridoxal phosphate-dependent enzyme [Acidiplasma sp.]